MSIIVVNDVTAYACGKLFGRTKLISLSPKKTIEGFIGAFVLTIVYAAFAGNLMTKIDYLICPSKNNIFMNYKNYMLSCPFNELRSLEDFLRKPLSTNFGIINKLSRIQLHSIVIAVFGSIIAPFGGFFASGFKRSFHIKEFSNSIPGHGGITDRMDCQFLMAVFSNIYYKTFIRDKPWNLDSVFLLILQNLEFEDQILLLHKLENALLSK